MFEQEKQMTAEERFKKLQMEILAVFICIIFVVTAFLAVVLLRRSDAIIREKVSGLIAADSRQLELNINSYLDKVETTAALLFSDEAYYLYDATDESLDDYTKLKSEEKILDRIVDLGLMENFADLGIVYANDHTVGWISRVTDGMFPEGGMYDTFSAYITNDRTSDGWFFGLNGNVDRMYYVKRLNSNAVLIASFYNKELNSVFEYPEQLKDMTIRLIDEKNRIVFSSQKREIGEMLPEEIGEHIAGKTTAAIMEKSYLINCNVCENNWRVVCSIPTEVILKENRDLRRFVICFAIVLAIGFVVIGLVMIRRITKPMDGMVSHLAEKASFDHLSGVLNKGSFQDKVTERIKLYNADRFLVLVMLDVDNFKQINDKLGHAHGDQVITRMGNMLKQMFDERIPIGRVGGDEFALYMEFHRVKEELAKQRVIRDLESVLETFLEEFAVERENCDISLSAGICIVQDEEQMSFDSLYQKADSALYVSKRSGKNQYTMYQEGMEDAQ